MERYTIPHNVNTACITVLTFPDGIEEAFQQLRAFFPSTEQRPRKYFGISYPQQNGKLMYKAAVELFQGECSSFENFVIEESFSESMQKLKKAYENTIVNEVWNDTTINSSLQQILYF